MFVEGYLNRPESLEHAAAREIKEETGMTVSSLNLQTHRCAISPLLWMTDCSELSTNEEIGSCRRFAPDETRENILQDSLASYFLNSYLDESTNL